MVTYAERLKELDESTNDEDCPPTLFRKYRAEARRIRERLYAWPGPDGVKPNEEI